MLSMDSRGAALKANAAVFLVLASLALLIRIWVRIKTTKRFWMDDWILLVAVAFFNTFAGLYLISLYWGLDKNINDPNLLSGKNALQAWYYADLFYILCSITLKFAAAAQIFRHVTRSWQKRVVVIFTSVHVIVNIYTIFVLIFRCQPVNWFWQRMMYNPHRAMNPATGICHGPFVKRSMHAQSLFNALVDFVFATLPLFIMKDHDMRRTQKIALWAVVILAELSGVAMIARVPAIINLHFRRSFPYTSIPFGILNTIESGLAILALCIASLSPLLPSPPVSQNRRNNVTQWDMESQSALRGIPLESGMGNTTLVESNGTHMSDKVRAPFKVKTKGKRDESTDTLVAEGWVDGGIMKTTDVITTHSQDDLGKVPEPAFSLKR